MVHIIPWGKAVDPRSILDKYFWPSTRTRTAVARFACTFLTTLLPCALLAAQPPARDPQAEVRRLAVAAGQGTPLVRIGLAAGHRVTIESDGPFRIVDLATGEAVWRPRFTQPIQVVAEGGPLEAAASLFRVQVGAFQSAEAAQHELAELEKSFAAPGVVHYDPDRGNWRVRLGQADDRLELGPLVRALREAGVEGIWIAEEPREAVSEVRLRLVDASYESLSLEARRLAAVPLGREWIEVDEKPYRGLIELRISPFATVQPINWVELENYLLGVVPAELGPEVWPQLAALQAQAVAARTYVRANLGQFEEEGFDLCATPRCQVYGGAAAEHPLSSRAVWSTKGEILLWNGKPIAALYTATCGGHTESGVEIFPEQDRPYLRGVPCRAEGDALASLKATIAGRRIDPVRDETGADVTRDVALLAAAGVIDRAADAKSAFDSARLRALTTALARRAGRPEPAGAPRAAGNLGEVAASVVADLGWEERARVLLSNEDVPALLRDPALPDLPAEQRRALAYLAWTEGLRPHPDGRFHVELQVTLARLAPLLVRIGESYQAFDLRAAVVSGVGRESIRLVQGKGELRLPVASGAALFGRAGGYAVPAERLLIWPGDQVQFHSREGAIDFLELLPPVKGAADDRTARVYSWEERRTRHELESAINQRVGIGRLRDLEVVRRGVSGRVVELRVVGSSGSSVVRGFDVRRLLDLRESLLVIEPQRDARGEIEAVVFAGKGWGHGVGLCQVGAYGMALRGADYRQILDHYYRGVTLERQEPAAR